jgi:hypothetical protein
MGMTLGHFGLRHTLARALGDKLELLRERTKVLADLEANTKELTRLDAELAKLEEQSLHLQAALTSVYGDNSRDVEARRTFPKKRFAPWGGITRTILTIFRAANGSPLWKSEVVVQLQYELQLTFDTPEEAAGFNIYVQQSLKNMHHAGHLERLHDPKVGKEGRWRLKATPE